MCGARAWWAAKRQLRRRGTSSGCGHVPARNGWSTPCTAPAGPGHPVVWGRAAGLWSTELHPSLDGTVAAAAGGGNGRLWAASLRLRLARAFLVPLLRTRFGFQLHNWLQRAALHASHRPCTGCNSHSGRSPPPPVPAINQRECLARGLAACHARGKPAKPGAENRRCHWGVSLSRLAH